MKTVHLLTAAFAAILGSASAQTTAATDPVGTMSLTIPAASDYALGVPLHRSTEYLGVIQSISGNIITVAGTPGWTASQFVYASGTQPKTYYARIDSGTKEGLIAKVTANDTTSVTVTLASGDDLSGVLTNAANTNGDYISIIPYWTPGTLFGNLPVGTQLLRFPSNAAGINLSSSATYIFTGSSWFQGTTNVTDTELPAGEGLVLRNNSAATVSISITGSVPMSNHRLLLRTLAANTRQDIRFFYNSPVPEIIGNIGLGLNLGDQLLVIDNSTPGKNKSASATLIWTGSAWFQGTTNVTNTFALQPGSSYILRKAQTASPTTFTWSDVQSYLVP